MATVRLRRQTELSLIVLAKIQDRVSGVRQNWGAYVAILSLTAASHSIDRFWNRKNTMSAREIAIDNSITNNAQSIWDY